MSESALNITIRPPASMTVFQASWQGGLPEVTLSFQSETLTGNEPVFHNSINWSEYLL